MKSIRVKTVFDRGQFKRQASLLGAQPVSLQLEFARTFVEKASLATCFSIEYYSDKMTQ